jgi:hypothetical protein
MWQVRPIAGGELMGRIRIRKDEPTSEQNINIDM